MLEKIDLTKKIEKKEYKRQMPRLRNHLYALQKASWDASIPVIILFEGWDAAGKGTSIQTLTARLDPRGFKLYPIRAARTYEKKRPWLWRFWLKLPGRGEWAIFDRSWYGRTLVERMEKLIPESDWRLAYRDIVDFERALADDGYLIIKFFLHISREEQRRRFEKLAKDPLTAWHVEPEDWEHHRHYDEWLLANEEMLERTETEWAPWTIVEATDRRYTQVKIFETIIAALEERLEPLGALPDPALWELPEDDAEDESRAEEVPAEETVPETPVEEEPAQEVERQLESLSGQEIEFASGDGNLPETHKHGKNHKDGKAQKNGKGKKSKKKRKKHADELEGVGAEPAQAGTDAGPIETPTSEENQGQ